jgi:hypothetical protein
VSQIGDKPTPEEVEKANQFVDGWVRQRTMLYEPMAQALSWILYFHATEAVKKCEEENADLRKRIGDLEAGLRELAALPWGTWGY